MTKLETNIANIEGNVDLGEFLQSDLDAVINAARAYSALQKLAPEIGALVEGYNNMPASMGKRAQESACRFINENHDGFKILKAIHDNLTKWGE